MEKTTMSVQELSSQLGISLPTAYELVKSKGFPSIRIGTRILIPVDAFSGMADHHFKQAGVSVVKLTQREEVTVKCTWTS